MKKSRFLIGLSSFVLLTSVLVGCDRPTQQEELNPQEKVDSAIASIIYSNLNGVVADFDLITSVAGLEDVKLSYTVNPDATNYLALSEDATKMLVTRPEFNAEDVMIRDAFTVTAKLGDATASKDFNVKIIKKGNEVTIGEFRQLTAGNGAPYVVYGTVVAENAKGLLVGDATGLVYAFDSALTEQVDVGDYVKIEGGWAAYSGVPQFSYNAENGAVTVSKLSGKAPAEHTFTAPELKQWTAADCDAYLNETTVDGLSGHLVQFVGTLSISGTYYNVNIPGATTAVGSIVYPNEALAAELAELDGKQVLVTGYTLYISGTKYVNIFTTDVEELNLNEAEKVAAAKDALKVSSKAASDFTLPATGLYETAVSWVSSNPEVLTIGAAADGSYPVSVVKGAEAVDVTLTATVVLGGTELTRTFTVNVPAADVRAWSTIEEVYAMAKDDEVTVRGIYQGKNNKLSAYNGVDQVNSVFIADGANWLQVYQGAASLYEGLAIGDAIEVKGKVAHYTSSDEGSLTTYEVKPTEVTKVDAEGLTAPVWATVNATTAPTFAQKDVNQGVHVSNVEVVSNTVGSYDNVTIVVKSGSTQYELFLDSRYTDVTVDAIKNLKAGDIVSFDSFVGANKAAIRLIYVDNLVVGENQGGTEQPDPTGAQFAKKSIADLAAYTTANNTVFEASGVIQNVANTSYGNFYLVDPTTGDQILVYGLSKENSSVLSWADNGDGTYLGTYGKNDQSYSSLGLAEGDYITMRGIIAIFSNKPQLKGIFVEKAATWNSGDYAVNVTADSAQGTVTTDKATYKYGEKVTLNITPASGYKVDAVKVNHGYTGTSYISDTFFDVENNAGVYSFDAHIINKVSVTFKDASSNVETITLDFSVNAQSWIGSAYNTTAATFEANGLTIGYFNVKGNSGYAMMNKSTGACIYNTTAIPGYITSITVVTNPGSSGTAKYYADAFTTATTSAISSSHTITGVGTLEFDVDPSAECSYFNVTLDKACAKNGQIKTIIINYVPAA